MLSQYKEKPIEIVKEIPIFSEINNYIENYEKISEDHLKVFKDTGHNPFMNEEHWKEVEDSTSTLLEKYSHDNMKILDVGVGMGRLLENFPKLDRYGMDISDGYLQEAKKKGIKVCKSLVEDIPYKTNFFDIVVSTDVLEHVLDLNLAIKKILSVLKDDGILIIRVPYKEDLSSYLKEDFPYELVHLRNFDEYSLQSVVEKIFSLKVLEITYSGYTSGPLKQCIRNKYAKLITTLINKSIRVFSRNYSNWFLQKIN